MSSQNRKPNLFPKLVLCTYHSRYHFVPLEDGEDEENADPADEAVRDAIHKHLITAFRSILTDLETEVEAAGYQVYLEFYCDMLAKDYEFRLDNRLEADDEVETIVERFYERANATLAGLPDVIGKLEVAEAI